LSNSLDDMYVAFYEDANHLNIEDIITAF
jgi:hypothetical protein